MQFGLGQFTLQIPPWDGRDYAQLYGETLDLAVQAEAAGFDSFWLAEHHGALDGYIPSLLPFLAAVAARTTRLGLGTGVLLAPLHDPVRVAEDAAVVDNLSGGRLNLGLGLGWVPDEYRMFRVPMRNRGRRLEEFVEVLRLAWTGEPFSYSGRVFSYDGLTVRPKPFRMPPVWLGGNAEQALERAARLGDGHFPPSVVALDGMVARAQQVLEARERAGVSRPYRFGMFVPVAVGDDPEGAWTALRDGLLHVRGSYMMWAQGQRDANARDAAAPFERQIREGSVIGTPQQVVDRLGPVLEKLRALGFEDVLFSAILWSPGMPKQRAAEAIERFGRDVIPALHR